jgi:hypothetical protein
LESLNITYKELTPDKIKQALTEKDEQIKQLQLLITEKDEQIQLLITEKDEQLLIPEKEIIPDINVIEQEANDITAFLKI